MSLITYKLAIIGTSFICTKLFSAFIATGRYEPVAVFSRSQDKLDKFMTQFNLTCHRTTNLREALTFPSAQVVYIGLPSQEHVNAAMIAVEAGKHVLSEKPLDISMAKTNGLFTLLKTTNTFFAEAGMYLSHPIIRMLTDVLKDGRLGELKSITTDYFCNIAKVTNPLGKGAIFNVGYYQISLIELIVRTVFGEEAFEGLEVTGTGRRGVGKDENVITSAACTIWFPKNRVFATSIVAEDHGKATNTFTCTITGTNGKITFLTSPWMPTMEVSLFKWEPNNGESETFMYKLPDASHTPYYYQNLLVAECLDNKLRESPTIPWVSSINTMEMLVRWDNACRERLGMELEKNTEECKQ